MKTGMHRAVSYKNTILEDFRARALANAKARERHWAQVKDRMMEIGPLAEKTAPLREKRDAILDKRKSGLTETAEVVGIAAACSVTGFALESEVAGVLFAVGGAVTAVYGVIQVILESRQLARIREEIASIRRTPA